MSGGLQLRLLRSSCPPPPDAPAVLDDSERARAAALRNPGQRATYLWAHTELRRLLGDRLGISPRLVRLARTAQGRPVLAGRHPACHFSLSHSAGRVLIGVSSRPIGVDVQLVPAPRTVELCARRLHPAEAAELAALPAETRAEEFARLWARKEAYLKGIGTGLHRALAADYLGTGGPDAPPPPAGWQLLGIPCEAGYAAAIALRTGPPT